MAAKRKPAKASKGSAAPTFQIIRGQAIGPHVDEIRAILPRLAAWYDSDFRDGLRVPTDDPCEWDLRCVGTAEEARAAVRYEYARELEWVYDYRAEMLALESLAGSLAEKAEAYREMRRRWTYGPCFGGYREFPIPWTQLSERIRRSPSKVGRFPAVVELTAQDFCGMPKRPERIAGLLLPLRRHAFEIDWSQPRKLLLEDFKRWMKQAAPPGIPIRERRGKDREDDFAKLKRLAAYRLKRAGYSRSKAKVRVQKHTGKNSDCKVLPYYGSEGSWSTAASDVKALLRDWFPDPRSAR